MKNHISLYHFIIVKSTIYPILLSNFILTKFTRLS